MIVCICEDKNDARIPDGATAFVSCEDFLRGFQRDRSKALEIKIMSPLEPTPDMVTYLATLAPAQGEMVGALEFQSCEGSAVTYSGFVGV